MVTYERFLAKQDILICKHPICRATWGADVGFMIKLECRHAEVVYPERGIDNNSRVGNWTEMLGEE